MNIFIYDLDIKTNARYYPNSHNIKIMLELSQMLSTAWRELTQQDNPNVYAITHSKHPCTLWIKKSYANYKYAIDLFYTLHDEWNYRYQHNKIHKSFEVIDIVSKIDKKLFEQQESTPFALAMPDSYKHSNPVTAYRAYFNAEKMHLAKWKNRDVPDWVKIKGGID